ncbi:MAG: hypothetical protein AB7I50_02410 [Vicinamibacterales bacterium]
MPDARFQTWMASLEERHLAVLRFAEVSRALRALSSAYVERRDRLQSGAALSGGGKRAAFALCYGPLHFLTIREILGHTMTGDVRIDTVVDLGCGTGAGGAACALALASRPIVLGVDRHHWAASEAQWTYRCFGLRGRARQGDALKTALPVRRTVIIAGWLANELTDDQRALLLDRLLEARDRGAAVLVVEPIARSIAPWWNAWARVVERAGGRTDEWRFDVALPDIVRRLDRAAGLSHTPLTARSFWLPPREAASRRSLGSG